MTRDRFLREIEYQLGNMSRQQKDEILADFREHFQLAMEEGRPEEEICASLGDPAQIASQFYEKGEAVIPAAPVQNNRADVSHVSTVRPEGSAPRDASGYTIHMRREFAVDTVSQIEIDVKTAAIELAGTAPSSAANEQAKPEIRVSIDGYAKNSEYFIQLDGGALRVYDDRKFRFLDFGFNQQKVNVRLEIPTNWEGPLTAKSAAGSVEASKMASRSLTLDSSAGPVTASGCVNQDFSIRASAGRVELANCISDRLTVHASAGQVRAERLAAGDATIKASAGSVDLAELAGKSLNLHASAGKVEMRDVTCDRIDLHASAGSVRAERVTGDCEVRASAGSVHWREGAGALLVSSSAGSVKLEGYEGDVRLTSTAGSVQVETRKPLGRVELESRMGSCSLEAPAITKGGYMRTTMGNTSLTTDAIGADMEVHSSNNVDISLPRNIDVRIVVEPGQRGKFEQSVPGNPLAANRLVVSTNNGKVKVNGR